MATDTVRPPTLHVHPVRVYYEDTDAGGVVYYANYLRFAERGRTEMLRAAGFEHRSLRVEHGVLFAVRGCAAEFLAPARLDDDLDVHTRVRAVKGASLVMDQTVVRDGSLLVRLEVRLACLDADGRPARLPAALKGRLEGFLDVQKRD